MAKPSVPHTFNDPEDRTLWIGGAIVESFAICHIAFQHPQIALVSLPATALYVHNSGPFPSVGLSFQPGDVKTAILGQFCVTRVDRTKVPDRGSNK